MKTEFIIEVIFYSITIAMGLKTFFLGFHEISHNFGHTIVEHFHEYVNFRYITDIILIEKKLDCPGNYTSLKLGHYEIKGGYVCNNNYILSDQFYIDEIDYYKYDIEENGIFTCKKYSDHQGKHLINHMFNHKICIKESDVTYRQILDRYDDYSLKKFNNEQSKYANVFYSHSKLDNFTDIVNLKENAIQDIRLISSENFEHQKNSIYRNYIEKNRILVERENNQNFNLSLIVKYIEVQRLESINDIQGFVSKIKLNWSDLDDNEIFTVFQSNHKNNLEWNKNKEKALSKTLFQESGNMFYISQNKKKLLFQDFLLDPEINNINTISKTNNLKEEIRLIYFTFAPFATCVGYKGTSVYSNRIKDFLLGSRIISINQFLLILIIIIEMFIVLKSNSLKLQFLIVVIIVGVLCHLLLTTYVLSAIFLIRKLNYVLYEVQINCTRDPLLGLSIYSLLSQYLFNFVLLLILHIMKIVYYTFMSVILLKSLIKGEDYRLAKIEEKIYNDSDEERESMQSENKNK